MYTSYHNQHWAESLRNWQFLSLSRTNLFFMKPEILLSCSKGPVIEWNPEPLGSSPNPRPISLTFILIIILPSILYLAGILLFYYLPIPNPPVAISFPSHFPWFNHSNNIRQKVLTASSEKSLMFCCQIYECQWQKKRTLNHSIPLCSLTETVLEGKTW